MRTKNLTGKRYFDFMTNEEQVNYNSIMSIVDKNKEATDSRFSSLMTTRFSNFGEFICSSFIWEATPQGKDYWINVAESHNN